MNRWRVTIRSFGTWSNMMMRQAEGWEAKMRRTWYNASAAANAFLYGSPTERPAQIPFMITADMKQQLADLGYKQDEVRHLTPSQAVEIITAGRPPTPRPISAASSTPTIATTSSFSFPSSSSTPASASVSSPEVALDASGRTRESADTVLLYSLAVAAPRVAADRPSPSSTTSLASSSSGVTAPPPPTTSKSIPTPTAITAIALTGLPPSSTERETRSQ